MKCVYLFNLFHETYRTLSEIIAREFGRRSQIDVESRMYLLYSMRMKVIEVIKMLKADGWYEARQKGSHKQFKYQSKKASLL